MNSINVIDSYFEGKLLVGIVATTGNVVRIEGNTIENMGGPAVIVNQIGALTVRASQPSVSSLPTYRGTCAEWSGLVVCCPQIRSNYFEANWQHGEAFEFQLAEHRSPTAAPCSDIIVNGDDQTVNRTKLHRTFG